MMKVISYFKILIGIVVMSIIYSCSNENILENLLESANEKVLKVIESKDKYEVQVLYTTVSRQKSGVKLKTYSFNEKPNKYFYPASTVKFPTAVLALEKLNELNIVGVNKFTHLSIDSVYEGHVSFPKEYLSECGYPNIADYIKQIFIVSDNEAFNRLYDFLGQKEINKRLRDRGIGNTRIIHRLSVARTSKQNMETNPINFYNGDSIIYTQPAKIESTDVILDLEETVKGVGYYSDGEFIDQPKDFSNNNFFGLRDQHSLMIRLMLPELFKENEVFNLTSDDYDFLKKYMSMLPRESDCPKYDPAEYYDGYVKFFMFGDSKESIPDNIKIDSKSGLAYGYLTDNAYIVDEKNNVEFFLSATIHVNENGIYNDDNYEYDEIGLPFLSELGRIIYNYEVGNR